MLVSVGATFAPGKGLTETGAEGRTAAAPTEAAIFPSLLSLLRRKVLEIVFFLNFT